MFLVFVLYQNSQRQVTHKQKYKTAQIRSTMVDGQTLAEPRKDCIQHISQFAARTKRKTATPVTGNCILTGKWNLCVYKENLDKF